MVDVDEDLDDVLDPEGVDDDPEFDGVAQAQALLDDEDDELDYDYDDLDEAGKAYIDSLIAVSEEQLKLGLDQREGFGKFRADQARDDHGRFASGGTMAGDVAEGTVGGIKQFGGSSVHLRTKWTPSTGFMVAQVGHEEVVGSVGRVKPAKIRRYIARHREALDAPDAFLGGWVDNGKVYLDVSQRFHDRAEAVKAGHERSQLAIYNAASGKSIYMDDDTVEKAQGRKEFVLSKDPDDADQVADFLNSL